MSEPTFSFAVAKSANAHAEQLGMAQQAQPLSVQRSAEVAKESRPCEDFQKIIELHSAMLQFLRAIAAVAPGDRQLRRAMKFVYAAVAQALEEN